MALRPASTSALVQQTLSAAAGPRDPATEEVKHQIQVRAQAMLTQVTKRLNRYAVTQLNQEIKDGTSLPAKFVPIKIARRKAHNKGSLNLPKDATEDSGFLTKAELDEFLSLYFRERPGSEDFYNSLHGYEKIYRAIAEGQLFSEDSIIFFEHEIEKTLALSDLEELKKYAALAQGTHLTEAHFATLREKILPQVTESKSEFSTWLLDDLQRRTKYNTASPAKIRFSLSEFFQDSLTPDKIEEAEKLLPTPPLLHWETEARCAFSNKVPALTNRIFIDTYLTILQEKLSASQKAIPPKQSIASVEAVPKVTPVVIATSIMTPPAPNVIASSTKNPLRTPVLKPVDDASSSVFVTRFRA